MRLLVFDISGSTGWCLYDTDVKSGPLQYDVVALPQPARQYADHPWGYVLAARAMTIELVNLVHIHKPKTLVIEETNGARQRFSQKFLEYLHFSLLDTLLRTEDCEGFTTFRDLIVRYINTSEWRRVTDTRLSLVEKNRNARLSRHKRKAKSSGQKLDKKALGIAGKTTIKHVAIRRVKELFGIELLAKQDDIADAILIGYAFLNGAKHCTGSEER